MSFSKRKAKKLAIEEHNRAYIEVKKPKPKKPVSPAVKHRAALMLTLIGGLQPYHTITNTDHEH